MKPHILSYFASFLSAVSLTGLLYASETCLDCHDDPYMTIERDGETISLDVSADDFAGTPHDWLSCTDCHVGLDEDDLPHADPIPAAVVSCLDCHDGLEESHLFHKDFADLTEETIEDMGLNCTDCHGRHTIHEVDDARFAFSIERQVSGCGQCHELESVNYLHSAHARALESGAPSAPTCLSCHTSDEMNRNGEGETLSLKIQEALLCMSCHVDNPEVAGQTLYGTPFMQSFRDSVHGQALFNGDPEAPTCVDCHGSHEVARAADQVSHVSRGQVVSSCSQCHVDAAEDYLHSIHASSFSKGNLDAPVCTDCHGEHNILHAADPDSPVAAMNLAEQLCGDCHGSYKLAERYGMDTDRVSTFDDSFHGLAARGGAVEVVNCASCHGYHDVRSETDPGSLVHPDRIAETCGACHEGANERFATGEVHVSIDRTSSEPVLFWIATLYTWGIVLIVGGMFIHNGLDFFHKVRGKAQMHWSPLGHGHGDFPHKLYLRMSLNERLQHAILALSFIILVITGFMLRYPEAWWVEGLRQLSSHAFEYRSLTHRVAGVVMCVAGVWHVLYVTLTARGRTLIWDLFPRWKDLADMRDILKYNLGFSRERPAFARFSYIEKLEYWALIWGSILMTVTGFLLWFENMTLGTFTKLGFDISRTVHFYEAILATLAIIVWHFYFVIFNPDVYPMNLSWLTGKMSEEEMATEHPLELESLKKEEESAKQGD